MRTYKRNLALLLVFVLLTSFFATTALAENYVEEVLNHTEANAGGWGLGTPIILAFTGLSQQIINSQSSGQSPSMTEAFSFLGQKSFWCGVAVDLALTFTVCHLTPMLPIGMFMRSLLNISAGFVGWEIGSGNLKNADWLSIGLQALAATATMALLPSSLGLVTTTFLAISAAIASSAVLEIARNALKSEEPPDVDLEPIGNVSIAPSVLNKERREAYLTFVKAAKGGTSDVRSSLERYRRLTSALSP